LVMTATIAPLPVMSIIEGFSTAFGVFFNSKMNSVMNISA